MIVLAFLAGGYAGFITALYVVRAHERRVDDWFAGKRHNVPVPLPSNVRVLPKRVTG